MADKELNAKLTLDTKDAQKQLEALKNTAASLKRVSINWRQKLSSRKLWALIAGLATSWMVLFGEYAGADCCANYTDGGNRGICFE